MLKVITVTTDVQATIPLYNTCIKSGFEISVLEVEWKGFGTKLLSTYSYLKANPEIDAFIFCDAFDVICLGGVQEFVYNLGQNKDKIILSAEKNCWPDKSLERWYEPRTIDGWDFVNSGLYYAPSLKFIELIESKIPEYSDDDQRYMTNAFLFENDNILIDSNCMLFQSYSFIADDDFSYENNRLQNLKTGMQPIFIHGNARTDMTKIYELVK